MSERKESQFPNTLPEGSAEFAENFAKISEKSMELVNNFYEQQSKQVDFDPDPFNIGGAFMELSQKMMSDPAKLIEAQAELWKGYMDIWQNMALAASGQKSEPVVEPAKGDKRFRSDEWTQNQIFDYIKQSYLLTSNWVNDVVASVDGLDEESRKKVDFYTKQMTDAMSPTNFFWSNPDVLKATLESKGENLIKGLENLLEDMQAGQGQLNPRMVPEGAFEVGKNVAVTPGKVVFQNEMMQLIQYTPTTEKVYKKPLLITPPWINKFYILDLRQDNSFIKWCVDKGYTVFVISWVNPDERHIDRTFESYMSEGILAALDAIEETVGEKEVTTIGYCIGGTLMSATLAYLAAIGEKRIAASTFFAAQTDFDDAGDLLLFTDEEQVQMIERKMKAAGFLEGKNMATTFNMLRSNDLIWSFVINNYLLGKDPFPFDLLFWNCDTTNMPPQMHSFYLRNMYQKNLLSKPGGLTLGGQPIDLSKVEVPIFVQASKEDHIAPYTSVFKATKLMSGPAEFMLAGSGHIAGVINHPDAKKYQHWTNSSKKKYETADEWLADATEHPGSWWPHWHKWLSKKSGPKVDARDPEKGKLKPIEDAPGSYVKAKAKAGKQGAKD
ncbi:class I poly(R)-hydroxyalkanoic acid synthase [Sneathiella sp. P13V-1]|uniref:PHA/PHB synthase family protein n=1 Tax=Sneathiella sp. P13V-1 TaxID=2697366 RepID=UPI00187BC486|nr:class I poly(R)-hydroxyalkanoic acid synthase [Sneathiella sp. P13V-1]MBE7636960.1 class I poly(R)-hydroxyalkanoic acid synthase [Sneathiella sp. P13V-1]